MTNIKSTPETIAAANFFVQRLREENSQWEREDKDAWSALTKIRGNPLPHGDEVIIAKRIYAEFPRLKIALKKQGIKLGEFCHSAGLTRQGGDYSKELHRLMLAPDADSAKVRPRRTASKYKDLIAAMAKILGENRSALAERMLRETSLHSGDNEQRTEVELIQKNLQLTVDILDAEFGWFDTFQETARLKATHAAEGGDCRWPQYKASYRTSFYELAPDDLEEQEECAVDEELLQTQLTQQKYKIEEQAALAELKIAMDVDRAYWETPITKRYNTLLSWTYGPTASGCLQDDSFFYVPHAYLGHGGGVCNPIDPARGAGHLKSELEKQQKWILENMKDFGFKPEDDWDEAEQCPRGQTSSLKHSAAHDHAWLIAYPAPDNTGLMPMLYIAVEECGPIIVPLDAVTLSAMRTLYWFDAEGQTSTFLERIKELMRANTEEDDAIFQQLHETAHWLKKNPFFKMKQKNTENLEFLENKTKILSDRLIEIRNRPR